MEVEDRIHVLSGVVLTLIALLVWQCPAQVETISGLRTLHVPDLESLENPRPAMTQVSSFFDSRNQVQFEVPWSMEAGDLIELYQIDYPHVRRQIAVQVGLDTFERRFVLEQGTVLTIELTLPKASLKAPESP